MSRLSVEETSNIRPEVRQSLAVTLEEMAIVAAIAEDEDHEDCQRARWTLSRLRKQAKAQRRILGR